MNLTGKGVHKMDKPNEHLRILNMKRRAKTTKMETPEEFLEVVKKSYPKAERIYLSAIQRSYSDDIITQSASYDSDGNVKNFKRDNDKCFTWFPYEKETEQTLQEMFGKDLKISMPLLSYLYKHDVVRISLMIEGQGVQWASFASYGLSEFGFYFKGCTPQQRSGLMAL